MTQVLQNVRVAAFNMNNALVYSDKTKLKTFFETLRQCKIKICIKTDFTKMNTDKYIHQSGLSPYIHYITDKNIRDIMNQTTVCNHEILICSDNYIDIVESKKLDIPLNIGVINQRSSYNELMLGDPVFLVKETTHLNNYLYL